MAQHRHRFTDVTSELHVCPRDMAFKTRIRSYSYSLRAGIRSYIRSYSHEESEGEDDDEEDGKKLDDDGSDYSAKNRRLRRKRRERG